MPLHTTSDPNHRAFRTQMSRVDWGDLKNSFTASFMFSPGNNNNMASAAAAVASSYGDGNSGALDDSPTLRYAPSRYDPASMDRIIDDDRQYDSDMSEDTEKAGNGGTARRQRRTRAIFATISVIVGASAIIGVLVMQDPRFNALPGWNRSPGRGAGANFQVAYEAPESQRLLEIAQEIVVACSESKLNEDILGCQHLCRYKLCCFEKGQYSCADDGEKDCAAYAGCEALLEGVPVGSSASSAHRPVKWG